MGDESRDLRNVLGRFATGVTVVTAPGEDGVPLAMTVNSFTSISLDPPLVAWSVARESGAFEAWRKAPRYAVNILAADQKILAEKFARKGARAVEEPHRIGPAGAPLLEGALATLECRVVKAVDLGDHVMLVGEVTSFELRRAQERPLTFFAGVLGAG